MTWSARSITCLACLVLLAACHDDDWLQYSWDDRRVLCSFSVDNRLRDPHWGLLDDQLRVAADRGSVALFHAHQPDTTITDAALEYIFDRIAEHDLDYVTFPELVETGPARAAVALAFDDHSIVEWAGIRERLAARGARVTFFLTRMHHSTPRELELLAALANDGHAIEAHAVEHLNAVDYIARYGVQAYLDDEVLPSMTILEGLGYAPTSYAYPFGAATRETHDAVLPHVARVRVSPGSAPTEARRAGRRYRPPAPRPCAPR